MFGLINAGVALWSTFLFANQLSATRRLRVACLVVLCALGAGLAEAKEITATAEDNIYADEIILARDTRYQHLVLTRFKDDLRLFLNSHLQSAPATNTATMKLSYIPAFPPSRPRAES